MPDQSSAATEHAIIQEITAPLQTLPDDPLSVIDADFPHALRGYDRVAVDDYVQQTRHLIAELQAVRSPEAAVRRALERVGDQITGVLQRAHETAEQITAQSRSEAEDRLQQARREAKHIADAAEQRVRELDADTDRIWVERQRIVADAEDLAGQLLALAKVAAERFPNDEETDAPEHELTPYDDAALVAGIPVEAGAPEADADPEVEEEFELEDEDVTRTVAFTPLQESEETAILPDADETAESPAQGAGEPFDETAASPAQGAGEPPDETAASPAEPPDETAESAPRGADEPQARRRGSTDDDATGVIRPASQAANRRRGR
jgi:cell division septum initiation protein DivIVA